VPDAGPRRDDEGAPKNTVCSVLFVDLVGFSKLAADRQLDVKRGLEALLGRAQQRLRPADRITLDTGDGFALCYLGAPEDVLRVAVELQGAVAERRREGEQVYSLRMGINLGPVRIVEDINHQRNAIGDGINTAQRVMGFAAPDQILVSRTYRDVTSCLSQDYAQVFARVGVHEDKHVRSHEVYEVVGHLPDAGPTRAEGAPAPQVPARFDPGILRSVERDLARIIGPLAEVLVQRAARQSESLGQLYRLLGKEIPTEEERERFLAGRDRLP
jgi:class 3 adenylate cyclase